jgi:hypothetical protein
VGERTVGAGDGSVDGQRLEPTLDLAQAAQAGSARRVVTGQEDAEVKLSQSGGGDGGLVGELDL